MTEKSPSFKHLECDCGYATSMAIYMRSHLAEGNCKPSDAHCAMIRTRLSEIATLRMATLDTIASYDNESLALFHILTMEERPIVKPPKERHCRICHRLTKETRNSAPECSYHTAKVDSAMLSIIEDMMYGN